MPALSRQLIIISSILLVVAAAARAQVDARLQLLDSPVKTRSATPRSGEAVVCSLALPTSAALYDLDTVTGSDGPVELITGELWGSFRVWKLDEGCSLLSTWSTALGGTTQTGLAVANGDPGAYWAIDAGTATAELFLMGVGTSLGVTMVLPGTGTMGAAVIDDNQAGEILCIADVTFDLFRCIDTANPGVELCRYASQDDTGGGAFGNGIGDAVSPDDCSGQTLVQATGTTGEGQVTRVGQYDCSGAAPACANRWSVTAFSTFTTGIDEFDLGGVRTLAMNANETSVVFLLQTPICLCDCQDIDGMDTLWVNASQGGAAFSVSVPVDGTLSAAIHRPENGSGKFVAQLHAGAPSGATIVELFDLGNACFDYLDGSAAVVENLIGKTDLLGQTSYFGAPRPDPQGAPSFLQSLMQPEIDVANLAAGTDWSFQAIMRNSASSSKKGASLTNGIVLYMQ